MRWSQLLLTCLVINSVVSYTYIGNEATLRQNLQDLFQGKLKFSKDTLPYYEEELPDVTPKNNSEYDFVIIGAGSAGAVVASRLCENANVTVLLIEAGSEEYPIMDIPYVAGALQNSDQINWRQESESSDKYCRGFTGSKCRLPTGKVTGGSSVLNFMIATRGNKENYDEWATRTGDDSWSYNNMLKYFRKLEDFNVREVEFDNKFHNKGGPLPISSIPFKTDLATAYIEAGKELGYQKIDYNGKEQIGFSYVQTTTQNGERWSSNRAYLHPIKNRTNLFFTKNSEVKKILINEESKTAYGVEFSKFDKTILVNAKNEVILCAGAINSPQILMLSGIGPSEHLDHLGIKVIKDAPVGKNLMDHIIYAGLVFKTNITSTNYNEDIFDSKNHELEKYITQRNGTLHKIGVEAISFVNIDTSTSLSGNPNIEILFAPTKGMRDQSLLSVLGVTQENQHRINAEKIDGVTWSLYPTLTQPKSRGRLLLRSKDPKDKPKIYTNYFDDPEDVRVMIEGIRMAIKISETKAFKKYDSQLIDFPAPCEHNTYHSDDYWECVLRTYGNTVYHHSGTCKMGREDDPTAVVNSKLQVIGIKGLRVVDASVMPNIITGHTHVPIVAIAEKISDDIKKA